MVRRLTRVSKEIFRLSNIFCVRVTISYGRFILPDDIPFDEVKEDDRPFPTGALPALLAVFGAPDGRAKSTSSPPLAVRGAGKRIKLFLKI